MINLNPYTQLNLEEAEEKLSEYQTEHVELKFKAKNNMPMTDEERDRWSVIKVLIEQMECIIEWITITDEDQYDWTAD